MSFTKQKRAFFLFLPLAGILSPVIINSTTRLDLLMYSAQKIVTDLADQVEKLPKAARPESTLTQDDRQFLQELQETQKNLNVFSQDPAYGEQLEY